MGRIAVMGPSRVKPGHDGEMQACTGQNLGPVV